MADWRAIYRRTWADRKVYRLSEGAELHFIKLITVADDEGFVDGDEILCDCYPGRPQITEEVIDSRNRELADVDKHSPLLVIHRINSRTILELPNFEKRQIRRTDRYKPSELKAVVVSVTTSRQPGDNQVTTNRQPLVDKLSPTGQDRQDKTGQREKKPLPPAAGSVEKAKKKKPNWNQQLVQAIIASWTLHFPKERPLRESVAQKILRLSKEPTREFDPTDFIDYCANHRPDAPLAYVLKTINAWTGGPGNLRPYHTFEQRVLTPVRRRPSSSGGETQSIGAVLEGQGYGTGADTEAQEGVNS